MVSTLSPKGDFLEVFMFTGIITHLGTFVKRKHNELLFVIPSDLAKRVTEGLSIAIDGVCLTVKKKEAKTIYVDIMPETLKKTILGKLKPNALVNLELPVSLNTFFSGHIVQGHIDGVGTVKKIIQEGNSRIMTVSYPKDFNKYLVSKGSIAINGVSLTIIGTLNNHFTVGIIPYTLRHTMFHQLKFGDQLNLEVDILAKYIWQKI